MLSEDKGRVIEKLITESLIGSGDGLSQLEKFGLIEVPEEFELPDIWDLPSRLFRFPAILAPSSCGDPNRVELVPRNMGLAEHPFVERVALATDLAITLRASTDPCCRAGSWQHAYDLIAAGCFRDLVITAQFSTPDDICRAIAFHLLQTSDDRVAMDARGARDVLRRLDLDEPQDCRATIRAAFRPPQYGTDAAGLERWAIRPGACAPLIAAWAAIFGIETGWFERDSYGFAQWSEAGRHGAEKLYRTPDWCISSPTETAAWF